MCWHFHIKRHSSESRWVRPFWARNRSSSYKLSRQWFADSRCPTWFYHILRYPPPLLSRGQPRDRDKIPRWRARLCRRFLCGHFYFFASFIYSVQPSLVTMPKWPIAIHKSGYCLISSVSEPVWRSPSDICLIKRKEQPLSVVAKELERMIIKPASEK